MTPQEQLARVLASLAAFRHNTPAVEALFQAVAAQPPEELLRGLQVNISRQLHPSHVHIIRAPQHAVRLGYAHQIVRLMVFVSQGDVVADLVWAFTASGRHNEALVARAQKVVAAKLLRVVGVSYKVPPFTKQPATVRSATAALALLPALPPCPCCCACRPALAAAPAALPLLLRLQPSALRAAMPLARLPSCPTWQPVHLSAAAAARGRPFTHG